MKDGSRGVRVCRSDVAEFLLQRGMDAAAKLKHHGHTGMHWAAYGGHADTVRVLLRHHAPVNVKDETFEGTPLGWALYAWRAAGRTRATADTTTS